MKVGDPKDFPPMPIVPNPVDFDLAQLESNITPLRNQLLIADQYSKLAGKKDAAVMPDIVRQWLEYRIASLIAQQIALLAGNPPPTIGT